MKVIVSAALMNKLTNIIKKVIKQRSDFAVEQGGCTVWILAEQYERILVWQDIL